MKKCPAGYYCPAGSAISELELDEIAIKVCPKGNYCPEGAISPTKCPLGTYNPTEG